MVDFKMLFFFQKTDEITGNMTNALIFAYDVCEVWYDLA